MPICTWRRRWCQLRRVGEFMFRSKKGQRARAGQKSDRGLRSVRGLKILAEAPAERGRLFQQLLMRLRWLGSTRVLPRRRFVAPGTQRHCAGIDEGSVRGLGPCDEARIRFRACRSDRAGASAVAGNECLFLQTPDLRGFFVQLRRRLPALGPAGGIDQVDSIAMSRSPHIQLRSLLQPWPSISKQPAQARYWVCCPEKRAHHRHSAWFVDQGGELALHAGDRPWSGSCRRDDERPRISGGRCGRRRRARFPGQSLPIMYVVLQRRNLPARRS